MREFIFHHAKEKDFKEDFEIIFKVREKYFK